MRQRNRERKVDAATRTQPPPPPPKKKLTIFPNGTQGRLPNIKAGELVAYSFILAGARATYLCFGFVILGFLHLSTPGEDWTWLSSGMEVLKFFICLLVLYHIFLS